MMMLLPTMASFVTSGPQLRVVRPLARAFRPMVHVMRGQSQADLDNHANQCNPNNDEYWNSRGEDPDDWDDEDDGSDADDNRANQMNPNNDAFWDSRSGQAAADDNRANQINPNNDA